MKERLGVQAVISISKSVALTMNLYISGRGKGEGGGTFHMLVGEDLPLFWGTLF